MWLRLPRHTWPKSWSNIEDPVVPPEGNLYGHPLLASCGTWIGKSTELGLFFVFRKQGLFLSVYVDDVKMAGKKQNLAPMWKKLMKNVDLDEPTSFLDHVYLGCTQRECKVNERVLLHGETQVAPTFTVEDILLLVLCPELAECSFLSIWILLYFIMQSSCCLCLRSSWVAAKVFCSSRLPLTVELTAIVPLLQVERILRYILDFLCRCF